jgi:hypothetical protein
MIVVNGKPYLFEVIAATHSPRRFTRGLDGGQKQAHKYADDCNHDEKFH